MAPLECLKSCMMCLICRRKENKKSETDQKAAAAEMKSCESQFDEHHLYLDDFVKRFENSHISPDYPEKSEGIPI